MPIPSPPSPIAVLACSRTSRYKPAVGRGVAQPGRALSSGGRGRRFESSLPDQVTASASSFVRTRRSLPVLVRNSLLPLRRSAAPFSRLTTHSAAECSSDGSPSARLLVVPAGRPKCFRSKPNTKQCHAGMCRRPGCFRECCAISEVWHANLGQVFNALMLVIEIVGSAGRRSWPCVQQTARLCLSTVGLSVPVRLRRRSCRWLIIAILVTTGYCKARSDHGTCFRWGGRSR